MTTLPRYFRLRIRDASNSSDALVITTVRGGTNPWLSTVPTGDGQEFDPISGQSRCGAFTGRIADGITSGTNRIMTSQLEDASFRQQQMGRRAFLEWSADTLTWSGGTNGGVLIAGFLSALRVIEGAEYEYTVSDPTREEQNFTAFKVQTASAVLTAGAAIGATSLSVAALPLAMGAGTYLPEFGGRTTADAAAGATSLSMTAIVVAVTTGTSSKYSESIGSFLVRWPNRGCVLGGPVRGGFLDQPDRGGWEMTVEKSSDTFLRFNAGYGPPKFDRTTNIQDVSHSANDGTDPLWKSSGWGSVERIVSVNEANIGAWPGLVCEIVGTGFFQPDPGQHYDANVSKRMDGDGIKHLVKDIRDRGMYLAGTTFTPAATTKVRVRVFTFEASNLSPIYWTGHPADLLAKLWTEAGMTFSAASITTVKNAIGTNRVVTFRIKAPANLGQWRQRNISAPFGIGVRTNDNGELEAFAARIPYATAPTVEITKADIYADESGTQPEPFAIDEASAIAGITFTHQRLVRTQDAFDSTTPDGFVEQEERFERANGDPGAVGSNIVDFVIDGMVHSTDSNNPNTASHVDALAFELFDRAGRGMITGEIQGIRGGSTDALKLGDESLNKHPYLPNHNKRIADDASVSGRAMQIVRYTWGECGPMLKLTDSGPNAQPFATQPTITIAASSTFPRTQAIVTITNAATLNAAMAGLRLQWAVTTGAAPAATDYVDVAASIGGAIPSTITLPSVKAGRTVWVRAAATKVNFRPSTFSSVANVSLTALAPVSGLSVTPSGSDGSIATVSWTPGDASALVDIYLRLSAAPSSADVLQRALPPGSTKYVLEALTPSTSYTVTVVDRDPVSGDLSAAVTSTFTAGSTTRTLSDPITPTGFCGSIDPFTGVPQRDGLIGIGVAATEIPGFLEVAIATETSVGSGTYGSFVTDGRLIPTVQGDWTKWSDVVPNDGLRRQLKGRHVAPGQTSSGYTSVVTVTPWIPLILPQFAAAAQGTVSIDSNGNWSATIEGPVGTQSFRFATSTSAYPSDATAAAGTITSGRSFSLSGLGSISFGQTIYITAIPYTGTNAAGAALPSVHIRGSYQSYTATKTTSYSRVAWKDMTQLGFTSNANNDVINVALASGVIRDRFGISVLLPVGVTLISAAFDVEWNTAGTGQALGLFAVAVLQNGTSVINSGAPTYAAGVQTVTVSLGSTVTTTGAILFQNTWANALGPSTADAGQAFLRDVSITYSQPKPDVNV